DLQIPPALVKFVESDAGDLDSLIALARYSIKISHRNAAALLEEALSKRPGDMSIRAYLAEVRLGQADLRAAREALAGAPLVADALPCLWKSHGLYWMAVGDWQRARACLHRYLAMNPNDLSADYQLVTALHRSGNTNVAKRQYRHVQLLTRLHEVMSGL